MINDYGICWFYYLHCTVAQNFINLASVVYCLYFKLLHTLQYVCNYRIPSNRAPGGAIFQRSRRGHFQKNPKKSYFTNGPKHPYPWLDFFLILERGVLLEEGGSIRGNTVFWPLLSSHNLQMIMDG